jgi:START domain
MSAPNCLKWKVPVEFYQGDSLRRSGWMVGLCIALTVLLAHLSHASEWYTVDSTTDGIQILRKKVDDSTLVAFRGIGVIEAPLPLVATVIFDTNRRLEWIEGLDDSKIIRRGDEDSFVEYDHIDMPIFMKDRDFVSKIIMSFDLSKNEMVFHYQPSDDPSAPRTNYIRGELIDATFILSSIDDGKKTRVDASFLCDPKGSIPKWLVNFFLKDWPKTTFRNLRKEVLKSDIQVDTRFARLLKR